MNNSTTTNKSFSKKEGCVTNDPAKHQIVQYLAETSPCTDLPDAERNILSDISTFLEKNDVDSVKRKTLELAGMIQARNDDLNKIRNVNRWTVPLSAVGLILTIIFGFLALK